MNIWTAFLKSRATSGGGFGVCPQNGAAARMKILLDACVPRPLRTFLANHTVKTAQEMGWGKLKNGALLQAVEAEFDAFVFTDKNLKYQQNLPRQKLAILVLPTRSEEHTS